MKLLIDGDVIAYRAGFATEKTKYLVTSNNEGYQPAAFETAGEAKELLEELDNGVVWSRKELESEETALTIADVMIGDIRARYADENPSVVVYLSGVGNFRYGIATRASYKGNRDRSVPPKHIKAIRDHLVSKWGAILSAGEEADDLIGIAATEFPDSVVCSIDKDLMQLPGRHYNFVTKEEVTVSPKQAALSFYAQVLSGDPVDNIPGLPGIGPVKAMKLLEGAENPYACWRRIVDVYNGEFGPDDGRHFALEAARLVYVRRKVGEQWNPPNAPEEAKTQPVKKASRSRRVPVGVGSGNSEGSNRQGDQV